MTRRLLIILLLVVSARAADSRWGWDGGCADCPEHVNKHRATTASWIRLAVQGSAVYTTKNSAPYWTKADAAVAGWTRLGVNIILSTPLHPSDLADAEILSWCIKFSRQALARYCNPSSPQFSSAVVGIEPADEPWLDNDNLKLMNDGSRWGHRHNRLGTVVTNGFWRTGAPAQ